MKKRFVSCCLLFISFFVISGQETVTQEENKVIDYKKMVLEGKIICLPIYPRKTKEFPVEDILSDHMETYNTKWDTLNFNPYWDEHLSFPFQLEFDEKDFSPPVSGKMVITSRFGWRRGRAHKGIDIDLQVGDTVKTILDGKIRYVGYHGGYGNTIVVRHHNGLETVYAHLSKTIVKENDNVKKGQMIGEGGVTGNARGSHLHLEVRYHGKGINPEYLFEFTEDRKIRSDTLMVTKRWVTPRYHRSTRMSKIVVYKTKDDIAKAEEEKKKIYTVKKGDTLSRIANKYGLAISEICKTNSLRHNSILRIGQQIIIY
ncbi:peptidoglycan DD-metalloendopeptidase family protein [Aquimarina sp. I32.4]|uniref:peptidoglycan DD-metalloendopeptidase family protein n=1 Tax=Aquimarina sp. I32.4 TaxID=2053903 RepID=UPI001304F203|nr:peptidoglycan DD-metalloendopeptidase family protein [Aquimarina sp. I32.4]